MTLDNKIEALQNKINKGIHALAQDKLCQEKKIELQKSVTYQIKKYDRLLETKEKYKEKVYISKKTALIWSILLSNGKNYIVTEPFFQTGLVFTNTLRYLEKDIRVVSCECTEMVLDTKTEREIVRNEKMFLKK